MKEINEQELREMESMAGPQAWHGLILGPGTVLAWLASLLIWEPSFWQMMFLVWVGILHFFSLLYVISLLGMPRRVRTWPSHLLFAYWLLLAILLAYLFWLYLSGRLA